MKKILLIIALLFLFPNIILAIIGAISIFLGLIQTFFDTSFTGAVIIGGIIVFLFVLNSIFKINK